MLSHMPYPPIETGRPAPRRIALAMGMANRLTEGMIAGIARYAGEHTRWELATRKPMGLLTFEPEQLHEFDGVISDEHDPFWAGGPPVVFVTAPQVDRYGPVVAVDDVEIGALAASHLVSLGIPHFALVTIRNAPWAELRCRGFEDELSRRKRRCERFEQAGWNWARRSRVLPDFRAWLEELPKPCAIFGVNDLTGVHVISTATSIGLRVPEEIAVLGVDNCDRCELVVPSLSSVATADREIGYEAARMLDLAMHGRPAPMHTFTRIAPRGVVQRGSTEVLGYTDPIVCDAMRMIRLRAAHEAICIRKLAVELGVSRQQLGRAFLAATGRTLKSEIDTQRSAHLRELLRSTTRPIKRLAFEMGFASSSELTRFCARMLQRKPLGIRRQKRRPQRALT